MRSKADKKINDATDEPRSFLGQLRADPLKLRIFLVFAGFCLLSKLPRLSIPGDFYFDEVYHAYTAKLYLHGEKKAYDPWAKSDAGRAIEWTHPPLSKLIMAGTMAVFGENSFGWRIGSVVFGTAASVATSVLAFELFGSMSIALIALFLMSTETLVFAQSRIAMNDAYFVFFMVVALVFYVRWKRASTNLLNLYATGLFTGFALGCKWTALYLFVIGAVDLGGELVWKGKYPRSPLLHLVVALCVMPLFGYLISYGQFFLQGWSWSDLLRLQDQMWSYHTGLSSSHSYTSKPWQWILNIKPVWMAVDYAVEGKVGHIYNFGNSIVLIGGLFAVYEMIFRERSQGWTWSKWFVLLVYFALWVPWIFSPRIMLFYHYMPAIPALCIVLARWLDRALTSSKPIRQRAARAVLLGSFVWMAVTYPLLTQVRIARPVADAFYHLFAD